MHTRTRSSLILIKMQKNSEWKKYGIVKNVTCTSDDHAGGMNSFNSS